MGLFGRLDDPLVASDDQARHLEHHLRLALDHLLECRFTQLDELGIADRDNGGRTRAAGQQGHLAHRLATADFSQNLMAARAVRKHRAKPAKHHHVERIARLARREKHLTALQAHVRDFGPQALKRRLGERAEQRRGGQTRHVAFLPASLRPRGISIIQPRLNRQAKSGPRKRG